MPKEGLPVDFVVDTGFTGFLAAPVDRLREAGWTLEFRGVGRMTVADDRELECEMHRSRLRWLGQDVDVMILDMSSCLLGFRLLSGTNVKLTTSTVEVERIEARELST